MSHVWAVQSAARASLDCSCCRLIFLLSLSPPNEEADVEEEHAEKGYGAVMAESSATRTDKVQEVGELQNTKPSITACLTQSKEELASAVASAAETAKAI